eukprot:m.61807 g.61807  ORF g.61807 m.61807 type:complete len:173 (-) comp11881_c0_seq3:207-725(-)
MAMRTRTIVGTGVCFGVAFALNAYTLASQQWVIRDFEGVSQYGMLRQCDESIYNDQFVTRCRFPPRLSGTWAATAMCMIVGLCILAYATYKAASAVADHRALSKAKWAGFWCAVMWALAAVLFPVGLAGEPVGGEVFRLPENSSIGVAYILFVVSLLTLFMGEIIALRIVLN